MNVVTTNVLNFTARLLSRAHPFALLALPMNYPHSLIPTLPVKPLNQGRLHASTSSLRTTQPTTDSSGWCMLKRPFTTVGAPLIRPGARLDVGAPYALSVQLLPGAPGATRSGAERSEAESSVLPTRTTTGRKTPLRCPWHPAAQRSLE